MIKQLVFIASASMLFACNSSETKSTDNADSTHVDSTNNPPATAMTDTTWHSLSSDARSKWHSYGMPSMGSAWKTDDSTIHLDASVKNDWQTKDGGDIISNDEYDNFELSLDWKISKGGNSGIMFYIHEDSVKYKYPWETGMEMQVLDNQRHADGKKPKTRAGCLYDLIAVSKDPFKPAGEWNHIQIKSNNGQLEFQANGEVVLQTTLWDDAWKKLVAGSKFVDMKDFGTFKKGRIGLQDHGFDVWYKNIQVRKL